MSLSPLPQFPEVPAGGTQHLPHTRALEQAVRDLHAAVGSLLSAGVGGISGSAAPSTTSPSTGDWTNWGTQTVTFDDPGADVAVIAWLSGDGDLSASGKANRGSVRVQISLDGGDTFTAGNSTEGLHDRSTGVNVRTLPYAAGHRRTGTPSDDIVVRAQCRNLTDTAGDLSFRNAIVIATLVLI